jgi:hypothetical protein
MEVQCECGKFRAELKAFPKSTPGRLKCYCDDCQAYLHHLKRSELLDSNGGTEIVPSYPADVDIVSGKEVLKCARLSPTGMFRFYTSCCNTPIANTRPKTAWIGFHRRIFTVKDPGLLDRTLGPVRSGIMGRHAKGTPPPGTPKTFNLKAFASVMPFMLKGALLKKFSPSPFFVGDGTTSIAEPHILSETELKSARNAAAV